MLQQLHKVVEKRVVILIPSLLTRERKTINIDMDTMAKKTGFKLYSPTNKIEMPLPYTEKKNTIQRYIYILEKI